MDPVVHGTDAVVACAGAGERVWIDENERVECWDWLERQVRYEHCDMSSTGRTHVEERDDRLDGGLSRREEVAEFDGLASKFELEEDGRLPASTEEGLFEFHFGHSGRAE